ncbi:MAG TPA: hypothetical protein ENF26_06835 [Methanomicrobia archaeon]|nr:hypothetical protein [Methanomicrobia archaeon]HEX59842.1 hypothetical protein [Methanomicrobia archaeon]
MEAVIPSQLRVKGLRFIKIAARDKRPIEKDWNRVGGANYDWDDGELRSWMEKGGNYGVCCGVDIGDDGQLIVVDCDDESVAEIVQDPFQGLPETFTVRTGGGGLHFYYFLKDRSFTAHPLKLDGEHVGDVRARSADGRYTQVVGPGSTHPSGNKYEIVNPAGIATITRDDLERCLGQLLKESALSDAAEAAADELAEVGETCDFSDFPVKVTTVVPPAKYGFKKSGDEWYGAHPVHGSTTGRNFWMHEKRNVWACFRHGSGGGPISLIAVVEGIAPCEFFRIERVLVKDEETGEEKLVRAYKPWISQLDEEKRRRLIEALKKYGVEVGRDGQAGAGRRQPDRIRLVLDGEELGWLRVERIGGRFRVSLTSGDGILTPPTDVKRNWCYTTERDRILKPLKKKLDDVKYARLVRIVQKAFDRILRESGEEGGAGGGEGGEGEIEYDEDLLYRIKRRLDELHVGDDDVKLLTFVLSAAALMENFDEVAPFVLIKGHSSAGKSHVLDVATKWIGELALDAFPTEASLKYVDWEATKAIKLRELFGEEQSKLRLMSTSDGGFKLMISVKKGDTWEAEEFEIPPRPIFTTTVKPDVDEQFENRSWILEVDESAEQTRRVVNFIAESEVAKAHSLLAGESAEEWLKRLAGTLKPCRVVVPYANYLPKIFEQFPVRISFRRDIGKLIQLVKLVAFVMQKRRPKVDGAVIATPLDLYYALRIAWRSLRSTLSKMEERKLRILELVSETEPEKKIDIVKRLVEESGISKMYAYNLIRSVENEGLLTYDREMGRYVLTEDGHAFLQIHKIGMPEINVEELRSIVLENFRTLPSEVERVIEDSLNYVEGVDPLTGEKFSLISLGGSMIHPSTGGGDEEQPKINENAITFLETNPMIIGSQSELDSQVRDNQFTKQVSFEMIPPISEENRDRQSESKIESSKTDSSQTTTVETEDDEIKKLPHSVARLEIEPNDIKQLGYEVRTKCGVCGEVKSCFWATKDGSKLVCRDCRYAIVGSWVERRIYELVAEAQRRDARGLMREVLLRRLSEFGDIAERKLEELIKLGDLHVYRDETGEYLKR